MPGITHSGVFQHGRKSGIGETAVKLTERHGRYRRGILVKAADTNTGKIYVGASLAVTADSDDETDGYEMSPSSSVVVEADDPRDIFIIASTTGQKVFWLGL